MARPPTIETLLKSGSAEWNKARIAGKIGTDHTGATFAQLFSANADLSALELIGSEWEKCDLSKITFKDSDLSNSYFHGGRLQDCDFRGANLEGATFEKLKLLRCDFTGARGLDALEMDEVDMDRVVGLDGEEAPPPPPPPAHGITSFTREQRQNALSGGLTVGSSEAAEPPEFRPNDTPANLLFRGLKGTVPQPWVLDAPGLRPPVPARLPPGTNLESLYREAAKLRLEGRPPVSDSEAVKRAQKSLRLGAKDAAVAAMYLREVNVDPEFRFSAAKALKDQLRAELDIDDLTASIDPRTTGALVELQLPHDTADALGEARRRLAATQLFTALLEAGFTPDNNWEEAVDASEAAMEMAQVATSGNREELGQAFSAFVGLPDEARLRRLAYLAEAAAHLELLSRLPEGTEPAWLTGPESRECDEREMTLVQVIKAADIPTKIPELAQTELGVPLGQAPEDSDEDLFVHVRCGVCGKEKLIVQSP